MPEGKDIFYNQHIFKNTDKHDAPPWVRSKRFPTHWNVLKLDEKDKTVSIGREIHVENAKSY